MSPSPKIGKGSANYGMVNQTVESLSKALEGMTGVIDSQKGMMDQQD